MEICKIISKSDGEESFVQNGWLYREVQIHVVPTPIPLIKSKIDIKWEKDHTKIKFFINNKLETSDMYDFLNGRV